MTTTNPDTNPTTGLAGDWSDFERMVRDDRWHGFGYLGARRSFLAGLVESGIPASVAADRLAEADELVQTTAAAEGLTYDQLFAWANSRAGRWYGDVVFGAPVTACYADLVHEAARFNLLPTAALIAELDS